MRRLAFALAFALAACGDDVPPPETAQPAGIPFDIEGRLAFTRGGDTLRVIDIEVADTDSTRQRGLMQRPEIPDDTGMLFVFPYPQRQGFYMANTPRSLDIQFYGPDSTLLNVAENTTPYDPTTLYSEGSAQFVVEVAAGLTRRWGLVAGDKITWTLDADAPSAAPAAP